MTDPTFDPRNLTKFDPAAVVIKASQDEKSAQQLLHEMKQFAEKLLFYIDMIRIQTETGPPSRQQDATAKSSTKMGTPVASEASGKYMDTRNEEQNHLLSFPETGNQNELSTTNTGSTTQADSEGHAHSSATMPASKQRCQPTSSANLAEVIDLCSGEKKEDLESTAASFRSLSTKSETRPGVKTDEEAENGKTATRSNTSERDRCKTVDEHRARQPIEMTGPLASSGCSLLPRIALNSQRRCRPMPEVVDLCSDAAPTEATSAMSSGATAMTQTAPSLPKQPGSTAMLKTTRLSTNQETPRAYPPPSSSPNPVDSEVARGPTPAMVETEGSEPSLETMETVFILCRQNMWSHVMERIRSNYRIAATPMTNMCSHKPTTILHEAIASKGDTKARAQVIREILDVASIAASLRNWCGSLPLHMICQSHSKMDHPTREALIIELIKAFKGALVERCGCYQRAPLHILLTGQSSSLCALEFMIQEGRDACFMRDTKGYLPVHLACSNHCSMDRLRMLLQANPGSLSAKTPEGQTLLSLAINTATNSSPNRRLIEYLKHRYIAAKLPLGATMTSATFLQTGLLSTNIMPEMATCARKREVSVDVENEQKDAVTSLLHSIQHKKRKLAAKD